MRLSSKYNDDIEAIDAVRVKGAFFQRKFKAVFTCSVVVLLKAIIALLIARINYAYRPIEILFKNLEYNAPSHKKRYTERKAEIETISRAVSRVAKYLPWRTDCMIQVMAAKRLLNARAIPSEFFLGVDNRSDCGFSAHAWLMCGDIYVTGKHLTPFTPIIMPQPDKAER